MLCYLPLIASKALQEKITAVGAMGAEGADFPRKNLPIHGCGFFQR
jgi:hypothetical protein